MEQLEKECEEKNKNQLPFQPHDEESKQPEEVQELRAENERLRTKLQQAIEKVEILEYS